MRRQLDRPADFVVPLLRQAWADFKVGEHLLDTPLDDAVHGGRPPYHAAWSKLQQALEKILKAVLLAKLPHRSDLAVGPHGFLRSTDPDVVAEVVQLLQSMRHQNGTPLDLSQLEEIEDLVPSVRKATYDPVTKKIVALAENSEYPYTDYTGNAVAPCDRLRSEVNLLRFAATGKNLDVVFRSLAGDADFASTLLALAPALGPGGNTG